MNTALIQGGINITTQSPLGSPVPQIKLFWWDYQELTGITTIRPNVITMTREIQTPSGEIDDYHEINIFSNDAGAPLISFRKDDVNNNSQNQLTKVGSYGLEIRDNQYLNAYFTKEGIAAKYLAGGGNAYACLDSEGRILRSQTPCV